MRGCVWLRFGRNGRRSLFHLLEAIDRLPTGVGQFSCPMGTSRWSFCLTFGLLWLTVSLTWGSSVDQTVGTTSAARCAVRCLSQLQVSHSSEIRYVTGNVVQRLLCRMLCSVKPSQNTQFTADLHIRDSEVIQNCKLCSGVPRGGEGDSLQGGGRHSPIGGGKRQKLW